MLAQKKKTNVTIKLTVPTFAEKCKVYMYTYLQKYINICVCCLLYTYMYTTAVDEGACLSGVAATQRRLTMHSGRPSLS